MFEVREVLLVNVLGKRDLNELERARTMARTAMRAAVALRETKIGDGVLADWFGLLRDIKLALNGEECGIYTSCQRSSRCFEAVVSAISKIEGSADECLETVI